MRDREAGQATIEWTGLVLLVALVLGATVAVASRVGGIGLAESVLHSIVCAVRGGCDDGSQALDGAYGAELAATVRENMPNVIYETDSAELPIDFRQCRKLDCSNGSNLHRPITASRAGLPVTAFTRVIDNRSRGGSLYLQYWFYYPESFSGSLGRELGPLEHDWPGYHPDDWEGYQLRIGPDGKRSARATAHGGYKNYKDSDGWGPDTGYYRVSGGSHAGHLVDAPTGERSTASGAMSLIPLETLPGKDLYNFAISPPWKKGAYGDPEADSS